VCTRHIKGAKDEFGCEPRGTVSVKGKNAQRCIRRAGSVSYITSATITPERKVSPPMAAMAKWR